MTKLIIMKGLTCSGKSTLADELSYTSNATILSSDKIGVELNTDTKQNGEKVFNEIEKRAKYLLIKNENIIIDATNLTKKRTSRWVKLAKKYKAEVTCVFVNIHPKIWEKQALKRAEYKEGETTLNELRYIRNEMAKVLCVPSLDDGFNSILTYNIDIEINDKDYYNFRDYYSANRELLIKNPKNFFNRLYKYGDIKSILPEIYTDYNFEQNIKFDKQAFVNNIYKSIESLENKNEKLIWATFFKDLGKIYPGIIKINKDNVYEYNRYNNVSASLAYLMMSRLGFSQSFTMDVALLIQNNVSLV